MKNLPKTLTNILRQNLSFKSSASIQKATVVIGLGVSLIGIVGTTAMAQVIATLPLANNANQRLTFPGSVDGNEVQSSWTQSPRSPSLHTIIASIDVETIKVFDGCK